jgi:spermidine synthase
MKQAAICDARVFELATARNCLLSSARVRVSNGNSSSEKPVSDGALAWLFFFSGFVALVYEALWQRRFSLVFGSAAPATAAVIAAYFAGLAIGAFFIGRRVQRSESPLRLYAGLERIIAAGAILVEAWLHLFDRFQPTIGSSALLLITKTILACVALAIPTICMGGTLPALGAFIDHGEHRLGRTAGLLYVMNTAGAALGVLAFPLILLPKVGAQSSLIFCAVTNLLISAVAYRLAGRVRSSESKPEPVFDQKRINALSPIQPPPLFLAFVSGLAGFVVQIQWNRAFAQIHENSLLSFAIITALFIAALAVGGQITRFALRRNMQPATLLKFAWLIAGILVIASPWIFLSATDNLSYIPASNGWLQYALKLASLSLVLTFPIATLIGIALPAIFEYAGRASEYPGKILGKLLTSNLVGSALGAVLAGFVLPKFFSLWGITIYSGAIFIAMAANFFPKLKVAFLLSIPVVVALSRIDLPRVRINTDRGEKLIAISEGAHGIVSVIERADSRRLKLNNAYVLGGTASTGDERMQSHIPLLLHPNPQRVAYLGLGTGISAGGAAFHPVQQITILEVVPEVAQAARAHFAEANMRFLDQPNTRLIVEDARNYLRHTDEKFDVIIGDLVVPWKPGEGALFTRENFQAGKSALNPGGLFCQWLPMFQLSEEEFSILLNTFLSVFPEALIWRGDFSPNETALAFIGYADEKLFTAETIRRRLAQLKPDPSNPQLIDTFAIWMNFIGSVSRADVNPKWRINSEDRPWVELVGPIAHARKSSEFTGRALQNWSRDLNAVSMSRFDAGEVEAAAMHAGDLLFEFTLLLSENNQPAAAVAQSELKQLLPPALYATVFP